MSAEDQIKAMMEARDRERRAVDLMRLRIEGERDRLARALAESEKRVRVLEFELANWKAYHFKGFKSQHRAALSEPETPRLTPEELAAEWKDAADLAADREAP